MSPPCIPLTVCTSTLFTLHHVCIFLYICSINISLSQYLSLFFSMFSFLNVVPSQCFSLSIFSLLNVFSSQYLSFMSSLLMSLLKSGTPFPALSSVGSQSYCACCLNLELKLVPKNGQQSLSWCLRLGNSLGTDRKSVGNSIETFSKGSLKEHIMYLDFPVYSAL